MLEFLLSPSVLEYAIPILLAGLSWLGSRLLSKYLKNKKLFQIVANLAEYAKTCVIAVNQTYVKEIRKASEDGKLTAEEKKVAKAKAMAKLKSFWQWDDLAKILGDSRATDMADSLLESAVVETKKESNSDYPF